MSDLDKLKDKYDKKEAKSSENIKNAKTLTKELESKKDSAPVRAAKQAIAGFRSQWSGIDEKGNVGVGKGTPGIYYETAAIPALAGVIDDKYAPDFAVEADKKAGRIRDAIRKDMGIEAPRGALEHFAEAGGTMLGQLPVPGAWLKRVLTPVKELGVAGKVAASPVEYLSPIVDPKKINYGVGTGFGGTIGTIGEMLEEPTSKALGGLIQKYENGGKVGNVKSFFSAIDRAIDTLKQKKGTGEQILKEIEKAPGVKKEELELRKISEKLRDKKSITQEEVKALASETPAPGIKTIVKSKEGVGLPEDWSPVLSDEHRGYLDALGIDPVVDPSSGRNLGFVIKDTGDIVDYNTLFDMEAEDFGTSKLIYNQMMIAAKKAQQQFDRALSQEDSGRAPKFERYTTPGGENYREILLQMERPRTSGRDALGGKPAELGVEEAAEKLGMHPNDFNGAESILYYPSGMYIEKYPGEQYLAIAGNRESPLTSNLDVVEEFLAREMASELGTPPSSNAFRSGHFDEPDVVVHARVKDRTGPNGEKVLYVEEIQSDWHQAARKKRDEIIDNKLSESREMIEKESREIMESIGRSETTRENAAIREGIVNKLTKQRRAEIAKEIPKDEGYSGSLSELKGQSADDLLWQYGDRLDEQQKSWLRDFIERWELDVDGSPAGQAAQQQLSTEYDNWLNSNSFKGVPDAPWKNTSNELAVKQILDIAAKEGYDTVAFSPGSEHAKRYGMSQYFDALTATKEPNGQIRLVGTKDGKTVVDQKVDADELPDYIGKEKAENIIEQLKKPAPRNEAADALRSKIDEWSKKYDEDFPVTLKEKLTPEEKSEWDTLLEESRVWDRENRVQEGRNYVMPKQQAILTGQDLELTTAEGAGKKKIYDEIIPNFVRKYAKKEFGAEPGEIEITTGRKGGKTYEQYLDEIYEDPYRYFEEDDIYDQIHTRVDNKAASRGYNTEDSEKWDELMGRTTDEADEIWREAEEEIFSEKAKELAEKFVDEKLRAFAVPVTPQMREKITSQGQPLFSVAAPVAMGAPQVIPQAEPSSEPEAAPEPEEMPVPYQSGGRKREDDIDRLIEEEPFVRIVRDAAKQYVQGKDVESGIFGVSKGPVTVGRQIVNLRDAGTGDYQAAQADFARLAEKYGRGNVAATVMKPDQTRGVYMGDVMASYPVGPGRVVAGVRGMKTPERTGVTEYNLGYSTQAGPGRLDAMVMQPKDRRQDTRYQVGYTLPFENGGKVGALNRVATLIGSRLKSGKPLEIEGFHGSKSTGIEKFKKSNPAASEGLADSEMGALWITPNRALAEQYASGKTMDNQFPSEKSGEVYEILASLKNPLVLWDDHYLPWNKNQAANINSPYTRKFALEYAKNSGHDSVVFANKSGKKREVSNFEVAILPDEHGEYPGISKKGSSTDADDSVGFENGGRVGKVRAAADKVMRVLHGSPTNVLPEAGRPLDVTTESGYAVKRGTDKMLGKEGPPMVNKFDIPEGRLLRFEEQYSPEDVALMRRYFNKLPQGQAMSGEDIWDLAQGRDVIMEGIAKSGGFAGYERPNTGAVGKGQWFRVTDPEELKKARKHGGVV